MAPSDDSKIQELHKSFEKEGIAHEFLWVLKETQDPAQITKILERRKAGEPLAYIQGHWSFWNLELAVGPGVLIPRPETEELAENIFQKIKAKSRFYPRWNIVDCGAGSGCLGLAIAHELLEQNVLLSEVLSLTLVEQSQEALPYLKKNVEALLLKFPSMKSQIHIVEGSWNAWSPSEPVQVFLSNPPYISGQEGKNYDASKDDADSEVRAFEPHEALYPKDLEQFPDASGPYRELLRLASMTMEVGGVAGFELGPAQAVWICEFVRENFPTLRGKLAKDLAGKDRFFYFERVA
ncbi:peptide chain release factor N(5)-glutamine methyltransferase [bacterium]|nr:peptide chain release factor N(5)-glutamine methyltransferase [bacterium]